MNRGFEELFTIHVVALHSIKPVTLTSLRTRSRHRTVIYLDPDIWCPAFERLAKLLPRITSFLRRIVPFENSATAVYIQGCSAWDLHFGFLATRRSEVTTLFFTGEYRAGIAMRLRLWHFLDQRWELAPLISPCGGRPGYNMFLEPF